MDVIGYNSARATVPQRETMTAKEPNGRPPEEDLQFDRAEFAVSAEQVACSSCQGHIASTYFQVGGAVVCDTCRIGIESALAGGSGFGRFAKAALFGGVAAVGGAGIYFAIVALTGYELALVAIVVGYLVGAGVRLGAERRGGWLYQTLAILLTYTAIVATYVPMIIRGLEQLPAESQSAARGESDSPARSESPGAAGSEPAGESMQDMWNSDDAAKRLVVFVVIVFVAFVSPFMAGFENIIGLLIIAFALYQAWVMNKKLRIEISGPYRVGPDAEEAAHDAGGGAHV